MNILIFYTKVETHIECFMRMIYIDDMTPSEFVFYGCDIYGRHTYSERFVRMTRTRTRLTAQNEYSAVTHVKAQNKSRV